MVDSKAMPFNHYSMLPLIYKLEGWFLLFLFLRPVCFEVRIYLMYVKFALPEEDPKRKEEGISEQLTEQVEGLRD